MMTRPELDPSIDLLPHIHRTNRPPFIIVHRQSIHHPFPHSSLGLHPSFPHPFIHLRLHHPCICIYTIPPPIHPSITSSIQLSSSIHPPATNTSSTCTGPKVLRSFSVRNGVKAPMYSTNHAVEFNSGSLAL